MSQCASCGHQVDEHDRDVRFRLPDVIAALPDQEASDGIRMDDPDPNRADMIDTKQFGSFFRSLVQVRLSGGYSITYGVWVNVDFDDLGRALAVWNEPDYADLRMTGTLANAIEPWEVLGSSVTLGVLDVDEMPCVVDSSDDTLRAVVSREWDHGPVLSVLSRLH
ncbi:DUF2199 domain-containing protein [Nocardioides sp. AN3]